MNLQKGNLYLIIAIIVGVVAIGVIAFALGKYSNDIATNNFELEEEKTVPEIEEQEEIISSKKTDEMADWKTYKDTEFGYEIKYPKNWNYGPNILKEKSNIIFCPPEFSDPNDLELKCKWISQDGHMPKSLAPIELFVDKLKDFSGKTTGEGFWKDSTGTYLCRLNLSNKSYQNVYNQMLSTFKFIEIDKTANWKTYKNTKYSYEVKYPSETQIIEDEKEYVRFFLPPKPRVSAPVDILICDNPKELSVKKFMMKKDGDLPLKYIETIFIDNTEAVKYYADGGGASPYTVLIAKGKLIYRLDSYRGFDELFNQILSTFKFTK